MSRVPNAELVVALDFPKAEEAVALAKSLAGTVPWVKVGLELFVAEGPGIIARFKEMGFKVFCDLKLHDIPNTVRGAVLSVAATGADMVTLHASGGARMLQAAAEARATLPRANAPLLMAVTMLTSLAAEDTDGIYVKPPSAMALDLAGKAFDNGMDGVVCSPHEAGAVKAANGPNFLCLTPGIRLAAANDDQRRTATPGQAVAAGADFLVVGRPITRAADPAAAATAVIEDMRRTSPGS
ncbi:Orotidine 5'-phosphate decarboxylase subfamily 1 core [Desulfovibrio sp. X2]|uniref:orotidine-5'-phosphate decarboxylase n=1 Tax=Desulfovibrio sp. X2 TaxID=941449 RepID=UPI000358CF22|nr:orotidine-5'-phosphate decarboxylase [Desulfovibrio sp. X2]EPR41449.1 Orotidine 5'-phosphate decarboxylase subfamily 1 core [Desulfovibrio sp. X2]